VLACALLINWSLPVAWAQSPGRIAPLPADSGETWTVPPAWQEMSLDNQATAESTPSVDPTADYWQYRDVAVQPAQHQGYQNPYITAPPDYASAGVVMQPVYPRGTDWGLQILPDGLIYRSYMAGPRESKLQLNHLHERGSGETLWDVTLGGRRGVLRWGSTDPLKPEGWQLDLEGAALVRLNLDNNRDVDASDFRFGVPLTYGCGQWQYKFGYYHLSSHLGDEFIDRTPGAQRVNYVRDAIIVGAAYNPTPAWRLYGEVAWAFFTAGGAEPWEFQFGAEYAQPGPTGINGTPYFATNGHLREEIDFGGDYTVQVGWLWRGDSGSQFRTGFQFLTGKSNYYQWFDQSETQFGFGIWYDY
jgi:hypothetical protein